MVTCAREASYSGDNRSEVPCIDIRRMRTKLQLLRSRAHSQPTQCKSFITRETTPISFDLCMVYPARMSWPLQATPSCLEDHVRIARSLIRGDIPPSSRIDLRLRPPPRKRADPVSGRLLAAGMGRRIGLHASAGLSRAGNPRQRVTNLSTSPCIT